MNLNHAPIRLEPPRPVPLPAHARAEALFAVTHAHLVRPTQVALGWVALKTAQGHPVRQSRVARPRLTLVRA